MLENKTSLNCSLLNIVCRTLILQKGIVKMKRFITYSRKYRGGMLENNTAVTILQGEMKMDIL